MFSHDTTLIAPTADGLAAAISAAIRAANKGCRKNRLSDPPPGYDDFVRAHLTQPEGASWWLSDHNPHPATACTRVALAWWTDRAGRRHYRIASARGVARDRRLADLLAGIPVERAPLFRIDPRVFHRVRQGQTEMIALCGCGVFGPPEAIGWMGERCGPCHDRAESAVPLPSQQAWLWQGEEWEDGACLAFAPDGAWLAAGGNLGLRLFEMATGTCRELDLPNESTLSVAFSPDGRTLAAGRRNGVLLLDHSAGRTEFPARLENPLGEQCVWDVHFSPANDRVFGRSEGQVLSWNPATGRGGRYSRRRIVISHLALSPDGRTLAASDRSGKVHLFDVDSATWQPPMDFGGESPGSLAFSPDSQTLACCCPGYRRDLVLVEVSTRRVLHEYPETEFDPRSSGWNLAFTPDGLTLITTIEHCVQARDAATGAMLARLEFLDESMQSLAVSPTGTHLAVGSYNGTIRLLPIELLREG